MAVPLPAGGSALTGVSFAGADSGWAVGAGSEGSTNPVRSLIMRWDGSRWARVSAPSPGGKAGTNLLAVATVSPSQAWATGGYDFGPESGRPLLMSWDGSSWTETLVNGLPRHGELYTVAAASSTDAWAAGYSGNGPLLAHFNGSSWTVVPGPPIPSLSNVQITGVTDVSPTSAWAIGFGFPRGGQPQSFVLHWAGARWALAHTFIGTDGEPLQLNAGSLIKGRLWVLGFQGTAAFAAHQSKRGWLTASPSLGAQTSWLNAVSTNGGVTFAVGGEVAGGDTYRSLILRHRRTWHGQHSMS